MPTVQIDKEIYHILKKISKEVKIPMSRLVSIAISYYLENIADEEEIPLELKLEATYWRLQELYSIYRKAKSIYNWINFRLKRLEEELSYIDWSPLRQVLQKYIDELNKSYLKLAEKEVSYRVKKEDENEEPSEVVVVEESSN